MPDTKQTASARSTGEAIRRSVGAAAEQAATINGQMFSAQHPILGSVIDAVTPFVMSQAGRERARGFLEGLGGVTPSAAAPTQPVPQPVVAPARSSMPPPPPAQDNTPLTAMDWAQARAAKMLSNPKATVAQLQAAMGMVPAPVKSTGKDRVFDTFRQANDAMFAHQIQLIAPLQQSDPAKYAAEFDKAQQAYIGNHLKSLGVDPLANTLAEMQTQAEKD